MMSFEITKFKLLQKGANGLEADVKTYFEVGGGRKIVETGSRSRAMSIKPALGIAVARLKYYYLILTGHWIEAYNNYFDKELMVPRTPTEEDPLNVPWATLQSLWDKTFIASANVTDDGGFIISGFLEIIPKKPLNISTPKVKMSDDYSFFEETMDVLQEVAVHIIDYFTQGTILDDPRERLQIEAKYSDDDMAGLDDAEVEEQLIEMLEARGAIILSPTESKAIEARRKESEPAPEVIADGDEEPDPEDDEPVQSNGMTAGEEAIVREEIAKAEEEPVPEVEEKEEEVDPEAEKQVAPAAPGSMMIPTEEIVPDPEIGEIVSQSTIDNNVPGPEIDHEGMARAEAIANQEGQNTEPDENW